MYPLVDSLERLFENPVIIFNSPKGIYLRLWLPALLYIVSSLSLEESFFNIKKIFRQHFF